MPIRIRSLATSRLESTMYQSRPQAPTPSRTYHGITESRLWTQESSEIHQDHAKVFSKNSRRNGRIYSKDRGRELSNHPLLGSSVADLSDSNTLPSFRTITSPPQEMPTQKDGQNDLGISEGRSHHSPVDQDWVIEPGNSTDWEALVADADQRFEHRNGNDPTWDAAIGDRDNEPSVQTTVHQQQCRQTSSASHAIWIDHKDKDLECHLIAPIPLDYNKPRAPRTPSIHTQGSVLDCTSPSFPKSAKAKLRSILKIKELTGLTALNLRKVSESSDHDRHINGHVEKWLENTELVEYVEEVDISDEIGEKDNEKASFPAPFPVWSPTGEADVASQAHEPQSSSQSALRDMTNLRQPRYLEKNSFFQDREKKEQRSSEFIPTPARAADFEKSLAVLEGRHLRHVREPLPTRSRSTDFESTLAFLEGRR